MDIFIGNLPPQLDDEGLKRLVEIYAPAKDVKIIKENGISRGFGFIKAAEEDANRVIQGLNRKLFEGKKLSVRKAHKKRDKIKRTFISKKWREKASEKV